MKLQVAPYRESSVFPLEQQSLTAAQGKKCMFTAHINTLCEKNADLLILKLGLMCANH
jgi:hypothetical protein